MKKNKKLLKLYYQLEDEVWTNGGFQLRDAVGVFCVEGPKCPNCGNYHEPVKNTDTLWPDFIAITLGVRL